MPKKITLILIVSLFINFLFILLLSLNLVRSTSKGINQFLSFLRVPSFEDVSTSDALFKDFENRFGVMVYENGTLAFVSKNPFKQVSNEDISYFMENYLGDNYLTSDGKIMAKHDITPFLITQEDARFVKNPFLGTKSLNFKVLGEIEDTGKTWNYENDFIGGEILSVSTTKLDDTDVFGGKIKVRFDFPKNASVTGKEAEVVLGCDNFIVYDSKGSDSYSLVSSANILNILTVGRNVYGYCSDSDCRAIGGSICTID